MKIFLPPKVNKIVVWLTPRSVHRLIIYAVIWLVLGFLVGLVVEKQIVDAVGRNTGNIMASMLEGDLSSKDFAGKFSAEAQQKLDTALKMHGLQANNIKMVKLFNLQGKILYASNHQEIGGYETEDIALIRQGKVAATQADGTYAVFVPIKTGNPAQRVGTFEFYFDRANLTSTLFNIRIVMGIFIAFGGLLTFAAIFMLIQRATTTIERTNEVVERLSTLLNESETTLAQSNSGTVTALLTALDAKDHYTAQHSSNVAAYAIRIGQKLNLGQTDLQQLETAAILHDLGKIGIQETILNKRGSLNESEFAVIKRHPEIGAQIVHGCCFLEDVADMIKYHHERYDGSGYPSGLRGSNIPLGARILAVADVYDALTSNRPYRYAIPNEKARAVLERGKGTQFDPVVVNACLAVLQEESVA